MGEGVGRELNGGLVFDQIWTGGTSAGNGLRGCGDDGHGVEGDGGAGLVMDSEVDWGGDGTMIGVSRRD